MTRAEKDSIGIIFDIEKCEKIKKFDVFHKTINLSDIQILLFIVNFNKKRFLMDFSNIDHDARVT
jgi:hypothetical protein